MLTAAQPTALRRLGALRLPPFLAGLADERAKVTPKGWPAWLPAPANRPDDAALRPESTTVVEPEGARPDADLEASLPSAPTAGGWIDSSLDLKLGLDVVDLGPVEWFDERDGTFG
ncbi:MAG TPA: hypothetical protein VGQ91_04930 [Ideonella sp.]|nr:hypothetical protein [Ideonella sp.]